MENFENQKILSEEQLERKEEIEKGFGIVLCTKQKNGETAQLKDQIEFAEKMDLPSVQFDFRNRKKEEITQNIEALINFKEKNPDVSISIHGGTPEINEVTLDLKNKEQIIDELELLQKLSGESFTVHPLSINSEFFNNLPTETKNILIENYCSVFVKAIKEGIDKGNKFTIAIENMDSKGKDGSFGQTLEDITFLINKIQEQAVKQGVDSKVVKEYIGATLDINHALSSTEDINYQTILEKWFEGLGDYLKVIHLYTPSNWDQKFNNKYQTSIDLATKFNPNAKLFMESKQDPKITQNVYTQTKKLVNS